jgi:hypothetical protein
VLTRETGSSSLRGLDDSSRAIRGNIKTGLKSSQMCVRTQGLHSNRQGLENSLLACRHNFSCEYKQHQPTMTFKLKSRTNTKATTNNKSNDMVDGGKLNNSNDFAFDEIGMVADGSITKKKVQKGQVCRCRKNEYGPWQGCCGQRR